MDTRKIPYRREPRDTTSATPERRTMGKWNTQDKQNMKYQTQEIYNETEIHEDMKNIRKNSKLQQYLQKYQYVEHWLTEPYTQHEVKQTPKKLKNRKSHGSDGIIGEALKCLNPWITPEITQLTNNIQKREELRTSWLDGTLLHIYKNKGDPKECSSYRPICLTQMIYKVWHKLLTSRLAQILHIITAQAQYGYIMNISTVGAITKVGDYLGNMTPTPTYS